MFAIGTIDVDLPTRDELDLGTLLQALADPVRLQIVTTLAHAEGEVSCGEFPLGVSKSTASHHFKVLRDAGVLRSRHEGTRRLHSLRRDDLDARFPDLLDAVLHAAHA